MNNCRRIIVFLVLNQLCFLVDAQEKKSNIKYDISTLLVYQKPNEDYILGKQTSDYMSRLEGNLYYSAGQSQDIRYEMQLRYTSSFSNSTTNEVAIRQMYLQFPISDFQYLTIGKKRKDFGASSIHSFSNRISPLEVSLDRTERIIPGIIEYDNIISRYVAIEAIAFFHDNVSNWKDVNLNMGIEITQDRFSSDIHLYLEKTNRILCGSNIYYNNDEFVFFVESIVKEKSDQLVMAVDSSWNQKEGVQYSLSTGIKWQKDVVSIDLEYAHRSEGYGNAEMETFKSYVLSKRNVARYNADYFGKDYIFSDIMLSHFMDSNLSLNLSVMSTGDLQSRYISFGLNYLHNDAVNLGLYLRSQSGNVSSEYVLYSRSRSYLYFSVAASF